MSDPLNRLAERARKERFEDRAGSYIKQALEAEILAQELRVLREALFWADAIAEGDDDLAAPAMKLLQLEIQKLRRLVRNEPEPDAAERMGC